MGFGSSANRDDEALRGKDERSVAKKRDELLERAEAADLIGFGKLLIIIMTIRQKLLGLIPEVRIFRLE